MDDNISIDIDYSHSEDSLETSDIEQLLPEDPIESFPIESPEKIFCALCVIRKQGKAHGRHNLENRRNFRRNLLTKKVLYSLSVKSIIYRCVFILSRICIKNSIL